MSEGASSPMRESSPAAIVPQKRPLENDHQPSIPSPLNTNLAQDDMPSRSSRAKKESLKKRESTKPISTPKAKLPLKNEPDLPEPYIYKFGAPKAADFEAPQLPTLNYVHSITTPDGSAIEFNEVPDHAANKKNFTYLRCVADPSFPYMGLYRHSDAEPAYARINFEDTAPHMFHDKSGLHVTTKKGFRSAKANVCAREGKWYYEVKITKGITPGQSNDTPGPHVRFGFSRRETSLETPVGADAYSYGLRDAAGQKVYLSRPKAFAEDDFVQGDVVGIEINLPPYWLHKKIVEGNYNPAVDTEDSQPPISGTNIVRDRMPIRYRGKMYYEHTNYHSTKELEDLYNPAPVISATATPVHLSKPPSPTHPIPALRTLPNSYIKIYRNGVLIGTPFKDLLAFLPPASEPEQKAGVRKGLDDGMIGYYPTVSCYREGAAEMNFGPDFWFPPAELMEDLEDEVDLVGNDQAHVDKKEVKNKLRPFCERFDEQIAEDVTQDIIDEVYFWAKAGMPAQPGVLGGSQVLAGVTAGTAEGEIRELVQDDE